MRKRCSSVRLHTSAMAMKVRKAGPLAIFLLAEEVASVRFGVLYDVPMLPDEYCKLEMVMKHPTRCCFV